MSWDVLMKKARERKQKYLVRELEDLHRLLVPRPDSNHWSNSKGHYTKDNIPALVTGSTGGKWDKDRRKMEKHLKYSSLHRAMTPEGDYYKAKFNPLEIPLLDILAVDTEKDYGWKLPSRDTMMTLQANRGLARSMVGMCKVQAIILNGDQTEEDQWRL